ncbi:MAG: hypothetical protein KA000_00670 [Candidatus Saccharicenans sp.]|nr:hypothetical protein [Candidatus Saccharicenans sp.]
MKKIPGSYLRNKKIKPAVIFLLTFFLISLAGTYGLAEEKIMLAFSGGYIFPADAGYKNIYGETLFAPEFKLGVRVFDHLYVYGLFMTGSKDGTTPDLELPAHSRQQFYGGGLGYFPQIGRHLRIFIGAGAVNASYKEEAMDLTVSGHKAGLNLEAGIYYQEKFLFSGIEAGYCQAKDTYEGVDFKIGGGRLSLVLGVVF